MRTLVVVGVGLVLAGCSPLPPPSGSPPDVVGPYSGSTTRFLIDRIELPTDHIRFADQLVPGSLLNNHFGDATSALLGLSDLASPQAIGDQIAAGVVGLAVELQSDDPALADDPSVGVTIVDQGQRSDPLGGALVAGSLFSNRTRDTTRPVSVQVTLPVMMDADPFTVTLAGAEIDLFSDGAGGFLGVLRGGLVDPLPVLAPQIHRGLLEELALHPTLHPDEVVLFDDDQDGAISEQEVAENWFLVNLISPDLQLFQDGAWAPTRSGTKSYDSLSVAFGIHLVRCSAGRCAGLLSADHCDDRLRDGDETDVDCGGSCDPCGGGAACGSVADCQSRSCAAGACAPPTCTDGIKDNLETGVDCGGKEALGGACPSC